MPPLIDSEETDVIMKTANPVATTSARNSLLVGIVSGLLAGCGDAHAYKIDPGHIDPREVPTDHTCLMGSAIELVRYSSACEWTSPPLASEVHIGTVFSADETKDLQPPCMAGPTPGFAVIFDEDSHSLYLDFSQVAHSDRFPESGFEGYALEVVLQEANGLLLDVAVDRETSNLDFHNDDLEWDSAHIELNFEGVAYDDQSMLKLNLIFARVPPV